MMVYFQGFPGSHGQARTILEVRKKAEERMIRVPSIVAESVKAVEVEVEDLSRGRLEKVTWKNGRLLSGWWKAVSAYR